MENQIEDIVQSVEQPVSNVEYAPSSTEGESSTEVHSNPAEHTFDPQERIAQIIEQGKAALPQQKDDDTIQSATVDKPVSSGLREPSHAWLQKLPEEQKIPVSMQFIYQKQKTLLEVIHAFLESGDYTGLDKLEETLNAEYSKLTEEGLLPRIQS